MIKFLRAILGMGKKTSKLKSVPDLQGDYVDDAVKEIVYAAKSERDAARKRCNRLKLHVPARIIQEAINGSHYHAKTKAHTAAISAARSGKGRVAIAQDARKCAAATYRKAIDRAISEYRAGLEVPEKKKAATEQRKLAEDKKSNTDSTIKIQNAAKAERESAKRRYKHLDSALVDSAIHNALNKIDVVRPRKNEPRNIFRQAIDRAIEAKLAKQRDEREETKAAQRTPGIQGRPPSNHRDASRPNREHQTKEEKQILRELEVLNDRHRLLMRKMRDVTFRGGKKSKNADYHDTKEQLIAIEQRIRFYQEALVSARNSPTSKANNIVQVGSTVRIRFDDSDKEVIYTIVSTPLLKRSESTISVKSPIGSALLGKRKGAQVRVATPDGKSRLRLIDVR